MNSNILKICTLIAASLLVTLFAAPVYAQSAGKLWFYSVDPPIISGKIANPDGSDGWTDPNYLGTDPDDWLKEGVVYPQGNWDAPYDLWVGLHGGTKSYDTTLVISINDAAASAITSITVTPDGGVAQVVLIGAFSNVDPTGPSYPISAHGVFNSAEWAGYAEVIVGDIDSETALKITIDIDLGGVVPEEAKIHFDAYGWTIEDHGDASTATITSPYSHDYTFVVPEVATVFAAGSSLVALGTYAYKRRKQ